MPLGKCGATGIYQEDLWPKGEIHSDEFGVGVRDFLEDEKVGLSLRVNRWTRRKGVFQVKEECMERCRDSKECGALGGTIIDLVWIKEHEKGSEWR